MRFRGRAARVRAPEKRARVLLFAGVQGEGEHQEAEEGGDALHQVLRHAQLVS